MTDLDEGERRSVRAELNLPLLLLVVVPALLGAGVLGAGLIGQQKTSVVTETYVPYALGALKLSENARALERVFSRALTGAQATRARAEANAILVEIEFGIAALPDIQGKGDAEMLVVDADDTIAELRKRIDDLLAAYGEKEKVSALVDAGLKRAIAITVAGQEVVTPVVRRLADRQGATQNAFVRVENLVEAAGELRTIEVNFERLAAAATQTQLKKAKQALMLDVHHATRLTTRMADESAREAFSKALGDLFAMVTDADGLWVAKQRALSLDARMDEQRAGLKTRLATLVTKMSDAALGANARLEQAERTSDKIRWLTILGLLIMSASSGGLVLYAARVVQRAVLAPLERLRQTTLELSGGDLAVSIDSPEALELFELAEALEGFRTMALNLERSNADLEQFATVASHDLQSPLREISNYLGLVQHRERDNLDPKSFAFIEKTIDAAQRMQILIEELLRFSIAGTEPDRRYDLDETFRRFQESNGLQPAQLTWERSPILVGIQLDRLFSSLLNNAVKFTPEGEETKINITVDKDDTCLIFHIRDHGIGIAPHQRDRIFELFRRLHTRTEYPGQGIGLAVCKRICESNEGQISVVDTEGKGTTFRVTLPLRRIADSVASKD